MVAAAAYLGLLDIFENSLGEHTLKHTSYRCFGDPVECAAGQGHYGIVQILLDKRLFHRDKALRKVLSAAASHGHE